MNHASLQTRVKNKDVNMGIIWDLYVKSLLNRLLV